MRKLPNYAMTQCGISMSGMKFGSRVKITGMKNLTAGQQLTQHLKKHLSGDIRQSENEKKGFPMFSIKIAFSLRFAKFSS